MIQASLQKTKITAIRSDIHTALDAYFKDRIARAQSIGVSYIALWKAMHKLALAGGKRLRPYMAVAAYQALGGERYKDMLQVAVGLELLHFGLLIHDDIIDRDTVRYGQSNLVGVFQEKYASLTKDRANVIHYAQSAALLAGDLIIAAAHQCIAQSNFDEVKKQKALQLLDAGMFDVVGGQLLDTESVLFPVESTDSLAVATYKTASYSFMLPISIGAVMADAPDSIVDELQLFGRDVGIAFQLVDDLLGIFGAKEATGKVEMRDVCEGKRTYVLQTALAMASPQDRRTLLALIGKPRLTADQQVRVRSILVSCGAKQATEDMITHCHSQASTRLAGLPINNATRAVFEDFAQRALNRTK